MSLRPHRRRQRSSGVATTLARGWITRPRRHRPPSRPPPDDIVILPAYTISLSRPAHID